MASSPGLLICEKSEGYATAQPDGSCVAYWDAIGCVWTCGFGTTGPNVVSGTHWSRDEAESNLLLKWNEAREGVLRTSPVLAQPENYNRLEAITDFAYNLGVGRYQGSSLRAYVDRLSWQQAADEFPKWDLAGGKVLRGLVIRRASERALFLTPVVSPSEDTNSSAVQALPGATGQISFGTLLLAFLRSLFG